MYRTLQQRQYIARFEASEYPCSRCGEIVELEYDLNNDLRWFNLKGTNFCGPKGRLSHIVDGI